MARGEVLWLFFKKVYNERMKKLYRSKENKIIFGIIGGIGEYMEVDPSLLRVIFLLLFFLTAGIPCILFYLFSALVVPKKS